MLFHSPYINSLKNNNNKNRKKIRMKRKLTSQQVQHTQKRQRPSSNKRKLPDFKNNEPLASRLPAKSSQNVSHWRRTEVGSCGVIYHTELFSIPKLFSLPQKIVDEKINDVPPVTKLLVELTKSYFTLSLSDFGCSSKSNVAIGKELLALEESNGRLFRKIDQLENNFPTILNNRENDRVFCRWYTSLKRFLTTNVHFILLKMYREEIKEIDFQWLFMNFTEIFLMEPQPGSICTRNTVIHGECVTCTADIRYCKPGRREVEPYVIVMTAEIQKSLNKENSSFIGALPDDILGQIGGTLLLESRYSAFYPGILGILCCGTKIIFLYSEITKEHLSSLETKGQPSDYDDSDNDSCTIYYTKAYDYMEAHDRNEIVEYMFWLGYLQSSRYETIK